MTLIFTDPKQWSVFGIGEAERVAQVWVGGGDGEVWVGGQNGEVWVADGNEVWVGGSDGKVWVDGQN